MEITILIACLKWKKIRDRMTKRWLRNKITDEEFLKFLALYERVQLLMLGDAPNGSKKIRED